MSDIANRFWAKVNKDGPVVRVDLDRCWVWTASVAGPSGYGQFRAATRTTTAHRASWTLTNGEIPDGTFVLHKCDNRLCVRPDHLFLGTHQDNMRDAVAKGRMASGEASPMRARPEVRHWGDRNGSRKHPELMARKLTDDAVREIRAAECVTQVELAKRFGVRQSLISRIRLGQAWKHIQ